MKTIKQKQITKKALTAHEVADAENTSHASENRENHSRVRVMRRQLLASFLLGILTLIALRFTFVEVKPTHYHANFAVFVNGQREEFKSFAYYEEVASCAGSLSPKTIVHMHDNVNHVAHVHRPEATWGQFFSNLGWTLGDKVLVTANGTVRADGVDGKKLKFIINGRETGVAANQVINSEDVLLVNYGNEDIKTLDASYSGLVKDAGDYNKRNDPSACTGSKKPSLVERLKTAVWR
jgi:hypothetical protein